jgi:protein-disulfide isomerase
MVFSDFECPYCGEFARETWPNLRTEYVLPGTVQFVFRHLPLSIHKRAERTAHAVECAGLQERFWPMHDQLFAHQSELDDADLITHAVAVGADPERFEECMQAPIPQQISADVSLAHDLGIRSTPAFLIGRRGPDDRMRVESVLVGANPIGAFRGEISPLLGDSLSRAQ